MKGEFLAKSPLLALPLGALFFFLLVFAAVVFVTMRRRAPTYDPLARLPLDGDEPHTPSPTLRANENADDRTRQP